jgi:uncharacterized protein involved in exopolysaccharide biosynthesis
MTEGQNKIVEDDEISLKELILKIQEYYREVLKNWKLLVLIPIPFVLYMLYSAMTTPPVYPATLTFMVNEDEGGGIGGVGAILGSFGFGGGAGGKHNLDKILELARSRKIIQQVIFEKIEIDGTKDYMANHLISVYDLHEEWAESLNEELHGFLFKRDQAQQFNKTENTALKSLYGIIVGSENREGFLKTGYSEETAIMSLSTRTQSESLSISLTETLYDKLSTYYVEKSIEKQQLTFDIVKAKVDSIKLLLDGKEYALAHFKDSNRGLYTSKTKLKELQLTRDVTVFGLLYGEALKNLEIADFSLKTKTPFVQLIDTPIPPLKAVRKSKLKAIVLGGIIGGFLAVLIVLGRKIYRDAMESELT